MTSPDTGGKPAECASPAAVEPVHAAWRALSWSEWLVVAATAAVVSAVTVPRLPPGICFGDAGGFQLAAATLGITHPPGYAGYVSIAHVVSWLPGIDAPLAVTLLCHLSGLAVVTLGILFQVRLGAHVLIASALALLLCAWPQVWTNLFKAEVYLPSLALLALSAYLLCKYAALGGRRYLYVAALLFGLVVANRPPAALALPFVLAAWWVGRARWEKGWASAGRTLAVLTMLAAVPGVYSFGYYWLRDTKSNPYNYLEVINAETHELPEALEGPRARLRRVLWHAGAEQFRYLMGNDWKGIRAKFRWLRTELLSNSLVDAVDGSLMVFLPSGHQAIAAGLLLGPATLGLWLTLRRSLPAALLLMGMLTASVAFVCYYRIFADAADVRPLFWSLVVLMGVGLSPIFPARAADHARAAAGAAVLALTVAVTWIDAPERIWPSPRPDARSFLEQVNLASLPRDAVIYASWPEATPLWYARLFLTPRPDVTIINAQCHNWWSMFRPEWERRTFAAAAAAPPWPGYQWVREGGLLRLMRVEWSQPERERGTPDALGLSPPP